MLFYAPLLPLQTESGLVARKDIRGRDPGRAHMTSPSTSLVGALIVGVVIGSASTSLIGQRPEQEAALSALREEARSCQAARRVLEEKLVALATPQSVEAGPSAEVEKTHGEHRDPDVDDLSSELSNGIHGLLREWQCGHGNMQPPRTIYAGGFGSIIVDVGLGENAKETMVAVQNGFVVLAFEPMLDNIAKINQTWRKAGQASNVQFVRLQRGAGAA